MKIQSVTMFACAILLGVMSSLFIAVEGKDYGGSAHASASASAKSASMMGKSNLERFVVEEHRDIRLLSISGIWWALAGFLVAFGLISVVYFRLLIQSQAINCFQPLIAWTFSIWAVLTVFFVGGALTIAFTLPACFWTTGDGSSASDMLYGAQFRDSHMLAVSGIWISFFAYLWALGLVASGFLEALSCIQPSCNTVIATFWTVASILLAHLIIGAIAIYFLL